MFLFSQWRSIPLHVRHLIAAQFGIAKSGPTHVVDNRVESDGYKVEEIEANLTLESLQEYTGSESANMFFLWEAMLDKIQGIERVAEPVIEETPAQEAAVIEKSEAIVQVAREEVVTKKRGRPAKK